MTATNQVRIGDHKLKFLDGKPVIVTAGTDQTDHLTLKDVGALAEFAAEAWLALTEEGYKPAILTENGYVYDEGRPVELERDCE